LAITVKEAMSIGGLSKCKVVAGQKGLNRDIDHVSVMEVPDVIQWIKADALLLSSLHPIKDDAEALCNLVKQLHQKGCAALAIKTHRFFDHVPEAILNDANELDFPIIEIAQNISYLDIMTPIMHVILEDSAPKRDDYEEHFQWIAELALSGKGLDAIVQALSKMLQNLISLESEFPFIKSSLSSHQLEPLNPRQMNELRKSKRPLRMLRKLNNQISSCIVSPLILNGKINGYVTCWETKRELRKLDFAILQRAMPLFALEFLKVKTKIDVDQQYQNEFLSEILLGNINREEETMDKAKIYDWDLSKDHQVMVLDMDQFRSIVEQYNHNEVMIQDFKRNLVEKVKISVRKMEKLSIVTLWSDKIVILFPVNAVQTKGSLKEHFLSVANQLQKTMYSHITDVTFTIGIGRFYPGLKGIHQGFNDAVQSIKIGKKSSGRNSIIHFDLLGIYRILGQFDNQTELKSIYQETIGILEDHDINHRANLTDTLSQYFINNFGLTETSEKMFIHINTLKYRLQKIEELTGYNINHSEGRFFLYLGLKIKEII
jgi:purine catabolism regulator